MFRNAEAREHVESIDEADLERYGFKRPRLDPPYLDPEFDAAWAAWRFLHPFRTFSIGGVGGMIANPIALSEIAAYLDLRGTPGEYRLEIIRHISAIDAEYRAWIASRQQR